MRKIAAAALSALLLAGCGSAAAAKPAPGLLQPAALQRYVMRALNYGPGALGATHARCLRDSGRTFTCNVTYSDGSADVLTITVAANGKSVVVH